MCYDISFTVNVQELNNYFPELIFDSQIEMNFDGTHIVGHAYGDHPIIYSGREDMKTHVNLMEWGCIPFYVKDLEGFKKQRASMLNARSEKILGDNKSYWNKIRNRRCLVPMNGFYEHRKVEGIKNKVPYFITMKDQPMFFLPGLYSVAEIVDKETGEMTKTWTFTMVTRNANALMRQIHNDGDNKWRMPLLLPLELSTKWLENEMDPTSYQNILDFEMPATQMSAIPVWSIRTPKSRPDDKAKNEYFEWENLPALEVE